ncbi:MAG: hypothetical protein ACREBV_09745 [Candidatus Zixiibacteriota bacterium]
MRIEKWILCTLLTITIYSNASADRRRFVWTYEPILQVPGGADLEFYQTTRIDLTDSWEYRIEIEHGLSNRWDFSVYQIFAQKEGESFKWDAFQLRTRYRISEIETVPFDPVLYLEYRRKVNSKEQNKFEGKLLLGKTFSQVSLAVNPVYEFFWAPGDPFHEIGIDVGLAYSPSYRISIGVESTTRHEFVKSSVDETSSYFGPVVSLASGPIWYSAGYVWGLNDDSEQARARFLMGVQL